MNKHSFTNLYPATSFLILLNIGFFALQCISEEKLGLDSGRVMLDLGAIHGGSISSGEPWRLISGTFLHTAWWHIGFNCMALLSLGRFLEPLLSKSKFFSVYMLSALGGSLVTYSWPALDLQAESIGEFVSILVGQAPPTGQRNAVLNFLAHSSIGCSGAVFGLLGLILVYFFKERHPGLRPMLGQLFPLFLALVFVFPMFGVRIDHSAHIGGFAIGGICGLTVTDFATSKTSLRWRIPAGLTGLAMIASLGMAVYNFGEKHWGWS
jgi:rhomboid protease GluP